MSGSRPLRASLAVLLIVAAFATPTSTRAQEKGYWVPEGTKLEPLPAAVRQIQQGFRAITVGEIQSMEDVYLADLKAMCAAYVDLITVEEKRRRGGAR